MNYSDSGCANCICVEAQYGSFALGEILTVLKRDKWIIVSLVFLLAVVGVYVALSIPNQYRATVVLAPAEKENGGQLGSLMAQYGGLAGIAGLPINKDASKTEQAIALVKSWPFTDYLSSKHSLNVDVIAGKSWDRNANRLLYDEDVYNSQSKSWVNSAFKDSNGMPKSWDVYSKFSSFISVSNDKKTGLVTLSVTYISPQKAKEWCEMIVRELNDHFQQIDKADAEANIEFLQKKIRDTSIANMQNIFFGMIEAQTKMLMLAEKSENYALKVVVPPMTPEIKVSPNRPVIVVAFSFFGLFLWCLVVLFRYLQKGAE